MRHGKRFNHLGRTASHRKAMLSNMASSLLVHKRINTTLAKAKELRKYVEPLITKAKNDTTHSRRVVFSYLQDKESVNALFNEVVDRVADRPGGYTRIIKLGSRLGDNAEMAMIELVDFNELLIQEAESKKVKTRRSRRGSKSKQPAATAASKEEGKAEEKKEVEESKADDNKDEAKVKDSEEQKDKKEETGGEDKSTGEEVKATEAKKEKTEEETETTETEAKVDKTKKEEAPSAETKKEDGTEENEDSGKKEKDKE